MTKHQVELLKEAKRRLRKGCPFGCKGVNADRKCKTTVGEKCCFIGLALSEIDAVLKEKT